MAELLAGLGSQVIFIPHPSEDAMRVTTFTKSNDLHSLRSPRSPRPMTPLFTNDTVADKSRRQIDLEVLRLEDHIRALKSQRNSLAPVATLPPEMLAKIFAYRVAEDAATNYPLNWIKVTQVSRYWRSVALDTPSLWTNITFTHPKWAEEMLKRSKSAGLTVKAGIGMSTPRMRSIVEQALRQATRIHHLDLHGGHGVLERVLTDLDFEAPMLRSLVLSGPTGYHSLYDSDSIVVPEKMMLCEMPYLRRVELRRCKVNWEAQNLANLQELQLQNLPEIARPSMEQLIGMLSRMPGLQVLDLTDALPAVVSATASADIDEVIRLPSLTRLVLTGRTPACVDLIRRISIPHQATLRINCNATSPAETEFTGLIQFVTKLQNAKGAKPFRSLHIQHMGYSNLQLRAWSKVIPSATSLLPPSTPEIEILMNWSGASGQNLQNDILSSFVSSVPLGQLQVLNMYSMYTQMPLELWRDGFGLLPKLQHVTIRGTSALTFTTAMIEERTETLSPTTPTPRRSSDLLSVRRPGLRRRKSAVPPVYFPALRRLELEDVDFEDVIDPQEFLDAFMDALMERCERKAEIQQLVLTSCMHLNEDTVELLEEIVVDVEWDQIVQGYTDEEEDEDDYSDYWGEDPYDDYYEDYSDDYGGMFF